MPEGDWLFKTGEGAPLLILFQKDKFNELTAKTLWLNQQGRPDLQLPTGFMYTWGKNLDDNNWKKLTHEMKYFQYTRHLPLILCADEKGIGIWIDGSRAIHANMRGHVVLNASSENGAVM